MGHQGATETLRMLTNRAKTAINLNDLRMLQGDGSSTGAGGTAFSIRKKSNDTVLQAASGGKDLVLPKKSALATLLVNKPTKKGSKDNRSGQQHERRSQNAAIIASVDDGDVSDNQLGASLSNTAGNNKHKNKSTLMVQGLISESLVNSYLTGSGSMAG